MMFKLQLHIRAVAYDTCETIKHKSRADEERITHVGIYGKTPKLVKHAMEVML
jgi:hypothetical protein